MVTVLRIELDVVRALQVAEDRQIVLAASLREKALLAELAKLSEKPSSAPRINGTTPISGR